MSIFLSVYLFFYPLTFSFFSTLSIFNPQMFGPACPLSSLQSFLLKSGHFTFPLLLHCIPRESLNKNSFFLTSSRSFFSCFGLFTIKFGATRREKKLLFFSEKLKGRCEAEGKGKNWFGYCVQLFDERRQYEKNKKMKSFKVEILFILETFFVQVRNV